MLTDSNTQFQKQPELWAGIECTINRIDDQFFDQLELNGHYVRTDDIRMICDLGVKALRYPALWERHEKGKDAIIDWTWMHQQLNALRSGNVTPIVGLVHHGSGPATTALNDDSFADGLAGYAEKFSKEFPWIEYYTPVNEPLTTARFSGLYGLWYPHHKSDESFLRIMLNQLKATVLSMQVIRKTNPDAKLIQTEDITRIHHSPALKYQADFENHRRWLTFDILCGKLDSTHALWNYFLTNGITVTELDFFLKHTCPPDIIGLNYYVTSERYLDEDLDKYPHHKNEGNARQAYMDVEMVRVSSGELAGLKNLVLEVWNRYKLPIAITEVHLDCTREQQLRWFNDCWKAAGEAMREGVDLRAVTTWSVLGSYNWSSLLTRQEDQYESGAFDVRNNICRPTAVAKMISALAHSDSYQHPLLQQNGWWNTTNIETRTNPVLILGRTGTLGESFMRICNSRNIPFIAFTREELDILSAASIRQAIEKFQPWAIINATGYVRVDDAESNELECFQVNATAPALLAQVCKEAGIQFLTFSSDLVFNGKKDSAYNEDDNVYPLNVYGRSKVEGERKIFHGSSDALIIRTSAFFGPWDKHNFVYHTLNSLKRNEPLTVAGDIQISPTYTPDLVNASLDLLIDQESGIWHLSNQGTVSWAGFAEEIAAMGGFSEKLLVTKKSFDMEWVAERPLNSVLNSKKGGVLPSLTNALERYFRETIH